MSNPVARLDRAASLVLVVCALVVTSLVVRREFFQHPSSRPRPEPTSPIIGRPRPRDVHLMTDRLVSDRSAPVRLVEFADFQCPFCADAAATIERAAADQPGRFAIEFHHLPISSHPFARPAAEAAECAAEQNRFAQFYFVAYANQSQLGRWRWTEFGKRAGVPDLKAFDSCVESGRFAKRVDEDVAVAVALGVRGTPTWLVGDSLYGGVPSRSQINSWIEPN